VRQVKSFVKSILIIFFHIKDCSQKIRPDRSFLHTTRSSITFYGYCVKMCEDFAPNTGFKRTGCYITTTHHLTLPFSPGNFWPYTTWRPPPTLPSSVSLIEDKTERPSFWHKWGDRGRIAGDAIHDLQDALKK
jgi:hypothetical protein